MLKITNLIFLLLKGLSAAFLNGKLAEALTPGKMSSGW